MSCRDGVVGLWGEAFRVGFGCLCLAVVGCWVFAVAVEALSHLVEPVPRGDDLCSNLPGNLPLYKECHKFYHIF